MNKIIIIKIWIKINKELILNKIMIIAVSSQWIIENMNNKKDKLIILIINLKMKIIMKMKIIRVL
jgi:hypothetical protein